MILIVVAILLLLITIIYQLILLYRSSIIIKKGTHGPFFDFVAHLGIKEYSFKAKFNRNCLYNKLEPENDWNKLFGFSQGFHHENSVRIGWRRIEMFPNSLEICVYAYVNGERVIDPFYVVSIDKWYKFSIVHDKYKTTVTLIDEKHRSSVRVIRRSNDLGRMPGYFLFPYFGGQETAPHDMKIDF